MKISGFHTTGLHCRQLIMVSRMQLLYHGGGTISSIFLKIGNIPDAQVFLGVVLNDKNGNIKKNKIKTEFLPPVPGV